MFSSEVITTPKNLFMRWEYIVIKILIFGLIAIALDKPVGTLAGQIVIAEPNFNLYTYDVHKNHVYAVVTGPREGPTVERGVWIKEDGSFQIENLPQGEYQLKVRAPGFGTEFVDSIFVQEGQVNNLASTISLHFIDPSVEVGSNVRVFTTAEQPLFWIRATGAKEAKVKVYRKDIFEVFKSKSFLDLGLDIGTDLSLYKYSRKSSNNPFAADVPIFETTRTLVAGDSDTAYLDFKLDKQAAGDYFAVAEVVDARGEKKSSDLTWFSVTDLGLIVKHAPDQSLVRAINLLTMKPVEGVAVQFVERNGNVIELKDAVGAKTGADGFATIKLPSKQAEKNSYDMVVLGKIGDLRAYGGSNYWRSESDKYRVYFYTDRPVYRLGQTVNFKGIARKVEQNGFKNIGGKVAINVKVEDPDNSQVWAGVLHTTDHGTFNGVVDIPKDGKTGAYQIQATFPDGTTDYQSFEVEQYRKPEYQVDVVALEPRVVAGGKARFRVKATYYFGAPVANARIKYSVYSSEDWGLRYKLEPRPDYYEFFDGWASEDNYDYGYGYGGDYLSEGTAQTDETGEAIIEIQTQESKPDPADTRFSYATMEKKYKVEAEVTDISRLSVVNSGCISVTPGDFALFVEPKDYVIKVGDSVPVSIRAVDYDGKPVANTKLTVNMSRWPWDAVTYTLKPQQVVATTDVITDKDGKANTLFVVKDQWPTDTFYISAEGADAGKHNIMNWSSVWVSNESEPYYSRADGHTLQVKMDKPVYKPGETAKIMISAPTTGKDGMEALVSVEGPCIYKYWTVPMNASAKLVEVPIIKGYEPNVFFNVVLVTKKRQIYQDTKMIKVTPENHFVAMKIETEKERYKPGETVHYKVTATNKDGTPAANMELSLGVVDESIYAIRADATPNIQKFFYTQRPHWVTTVTSFPEEYSGGPDKMEPKLRKDFRDTAIWLPAIKTDKDGVATATLKLPDNLTTWRATVRGIDVNCNVGSAVQKITVTQDIIVRLALPRFYSQGDEGLITAVVHNYSEQPQNVKLDLSISPQFKTNIPLAQTLTIAKDKAARFNWPVTVANAGEATVKIKAVGQTAGDALERKLPVRPLGVPAFSVVSGVLTDESGSVDIPVTLPPDAEPGTAKYKLSLAGSSLGPVIGNFNSLIDYPYGCTEQTMSRFVPSIVAMTLHKKLGRPLSGDDVKKFGEVYKLGMEKLTNYHHSDGGWGWWENDQSNPFLTAYVIEGFKLLNNCGYKVDKSLTDTGRKWMQKGIVDAHKQLTDPKHVPSSYNDIEAQTDIARMMYSLSLWKDKWDPKVQDWIVSKHMTLAPEPLSYLIIALHNKGDDATAKKLYSRLLALANKGESTLDWDHTVDMIKRLALSGVSDYTYRFDGVGTTALAMQAILAVEPSNRTAIESIKQWLMAQRGKDGWSNTKSTSQVFLVLMDDELQSQASGVDFTTSAISPLFGGTTPIDFAFNKANVYDSEKLIDLTPKAGQQTITLKKTGPGRLYYNGLLTYFRKLKPNESLPSNGLPSGLQVTRKFFRLETTATTSDGSIKFKSVPIADGKIKAGETVLMKCYVDAPMTLPYVMVECPLPSGAEVVKSDMSDNLQKEDSKAAGYEGDWGNVWWQHQDVLDDRIVFFGSYVYQGKREFHTLLRMEIPGTVQINPILLEGMYSKGVRAFSPLDSVQIVE